MKFAGPIKRPIEREEKGEEEAEEDEEVASQPRQIEPIRSRFLDRCNVTGFPRAWNFTRLFFFFFLQNN